MADKYLTRDELEEALFSVGKGVGIAIATALAGLRAPAELKVMADGLNKLVTNPDMNAEVGVVLQGISESLEAVASLSP